MVIFFTSRSGLTKEEVENVQSAIDMVAKACGAPDAIFELPRVGNVQEEDDLS
jgi:hypothetical protein